MRLIYTTAISLLLAQLVNAAVTTEERYQYYDVSGNSAFELRESIDRERKALGKRFDALTSWNIQWQFSFVPRQQKCKITEVTIEAVITYLLPRWPNADLSSDRKLSESWWRYEKQLTAHEHQHGRLVKAALLEVERAIWGADDTAFAPATCEQLELLANQNARDVIADLYARHRQFDLLTDHGRNTGATFP